MSRLRLRMAPTVVLLCCIIWDMDICVTWSIPSLLVTGLGVSQPTRVCQTNLLTFLAKRSTCESILDGSVIVLVNLQTMLVFVFKSLSCVMFDLQYRRLRSKFLQPKRQGRE
jgi:hypothetical protein